MALNPLNPSAGDVPMPEDQREVDAALRAGPMTHRIFPYVEWRYGERGRKFTRSDSAWLAWLVRHDQARLNDQVLWLRSVLSNRGMPSWILEVHLRVLCKKLVRAAPERRCDYEKLIHCARLLSRERREVIPDETWSELAADFARAIDRNPHPVLEGTGRLVVAAVADERLGIKNAVTRLENWLVDPAGLRKIDAARKYCPPGLQEAIGSDELVTRWREAVRATIGKARKA